MRTRMMVVMLLTIGLSLASCTREKKADQPGSSGPAGGGEVKEAPAGLAAEIEAQGLVDQGTACERHDYMFKAGGSQTLTFAIKLPPGVGDDVEFQIEGDLDNLAQATGMELSVGSVVFDTYQFPTWIVDCSEAFSELEEKGQQKPILITSKKMSIVFDQDGYGTVAWNSRDPFEELPEETVRAEIGNPLQLGAYPNVKDCNYGLSQGSIDAYFASVDLNVTTAAESTNDFTNRKITISGNSKHKLELTASKRRKEPFYRISGPDQNSGCSE